MQRQEKKLKFRLTGGKTPVSWQLPIKGMMLPRVVDGVPQGLKRIHYIPGIASVWLEDYKGDQKQKGVFFENGLLEVDPNDTNLLYIIKNHKFLNVHFEAADEDATAQKELDRMDLIEKALAKVNISDENELKANAMILIGYNMLAATETVVRQKMKKLAFDSPSDVLKTMNAGDFQAKYVGALAVLRGVVVVNPTQTACTWEDGKVIVRVAAGQSALQKLGEFLSENTEEAKITLQEIGERITRTYTKRVNPTGEKEINKIISEKGSENVGGENDKNLSLTDDAPEGDELTLEEAQEAYKAKFNKDVANAKKNDLDWILSKLEEDAE